jgi:hypothetical protein
MELVIQGRIPHTRVKWGSFAAIPNTNLQSLGVNSRGALLVAKISDIWRLVVALGNKHNQFHHMVWNGEVNSDGHPEFLYVLQANIVDGFKVRVSPPSQNVSLLN